MTASKNHLQKRSFTLHRHRTSIALEPIFWTALEARAADVQKTMTEMICEIDDARTTPLASAIRVYLFSAAR
jgi:predicted DNA-binding ribbon-helix-helix protein